MRDPAFMTRAGLAIALAALAVIQFAFLSRPPDSNRKGHVAVGDDLSGVLVRGADPIPRTLAGNGAVLVLVFDPECEHSRRVAAKWRAWLQSPGAPLNVVALAPGPFSRARDHAEDHGWTLPVLTVADGLPGSREHALISRTPWIFALDASGRVTADGHGSDLSAIAATVTRLPTAQFAARSGTRGLSHR
ncbi:MAG: hypothetical protein OXE96_11520 [Gemmatimonadetes bacterium]|nr:hypothetical protein [Gemmatimonadota bacterium]